MGFLYSQLLVTPTYPTKSFSGQTVIVTGANTGLGLEAARHFVRLEAAKVILAVRRPDAGETAKQDIEKSTGRTQVCEVWTLDMASYDSVQKFAQRVDRELSRLDVVVENAGIAPSKFVLMEQDESTITVNVVSTFLLALLLVPKLKQTKDTVKETAPSLSIVTSEVHAQPKFPERNSDQIFKTLSSDRSPDMEVNERYSLSKLLEVLVVREVAAGFGQKGIILNMLNPGLCHSALSKDGGLVLQIIKLFLARKTEVGSRTLLHAASAGPDSHGKYLSDTRIADEEVSAFVKSEEGRRTQKQVWSELSQKLEAIQPGILKNIS